MILIGSRALALRAPQVLTRKPRDFDFIGTKLEFDFWLSKNESKIHPIEVYSEMNGQKMIVKGENDVIIEFDLVQPGSSNELLVNLAENDPESMETSFGWIPSLDLLYAIKMSHRFRKFTDSRGFWKTALDAHCMKHVGAAIRDEHQTFFKLREQESYAAQKHPKLNVSRTDFFSEEHGVVYVYEHDDIHQAVKLYECPAYTYYLKDGEEVLTDKRKFFACDQNIRLAGGWEEAASLAIERSMVPWGTWTSDQAFKYALGKAASTITSGFFRTWIWDHLLDILKLHNEKGKDYYQRFQQAVAEGRVRRIKETVAC